MNSPYKKDRKLVTDFYMWMVKNGHDHNIRIRVETKAELFLSEQPKANVVEKSDSNCNLQNVMPMLRQIAECLDNTIENTEDDNETEWDKICDAVELLNDIAEDNKGFVRN